LDGFGADAHEVFAADEPVGGVAQEVDLFGAEALGVKEGGIGDDDHAGGEGGGLVVGGVATDDGAGEVERFALAGGGVAVVFAGVEGGVFLGEFRFAPVVVGGLDEGDGGDAAVEEILGVFADFEAAGAAFEDAGFAFEVGVDMVELGAEGEGGEDVGAGAAVAEGHEAVVAGSDAVFAEEGADAVGAVDGIEDDEEGGAGAGPVFLEHVEFAFIEIVLGGDEGEAFGIVGDAVAVAEADGSEGDVLAAEGVGEGGPGGVFGGVLQLAFVGQEVEAAGLALDGAAEEGAEEILVLIADEGAFVGTVGAVNEHFFEGDDLDVRGGRGARALHRRSGGVGGWGLIGAGVDDDNVVDEDMVVGFGDFEGAVAVADGIDEFDGDRAPRLVFVGLGHGAEAVVVFGGFAHRDDHADGLGPGLYRIGAEEFFGEGGEAELVAAAEVPVLVVECGEVVGGEEDEGGEDDLDGHEGADGKPVEGLGLFW